MAEQTSKADRVKLNRELAQMLKGGVIMDVTTPEQAHIAEEAGACAVMALERIPADSSAKMPDAHMDAIEPFDFDELVPFSVAYLPGYLAERYDQEADTCQPRAMRRMKGSLEDELQATVTGYDDVTQESINANSEVTGLSQALFPVWLLHTLYKDEDYLFAMNGQTGKLVGDLPTSYGKFWGTFAAIAAGLTAVLSAVYLFLT